MTDLLTRSAAQPAAAQSTQQRPLLLAGAVAALWSAAVGLALCTLLAVLGWVAGSSGTLSEALRVGADSWLLAHGASLQLQSSTVSVLPLGLTVAAGLVLLRAGRWVGGRSGSSDLRPLAGGLAILVVGYAAITALVAVLAATPTVRPEPLRAVFGAAALAALCASGGMLRGVGRNLGSLGVPTAVVAGAAGLAAGIAALVAAGAALVAGALIVDFSTAQAVVGSLRPGPVGGVILVLTGIILLPNAALCAAAFLVGPGFTVGAETLVTPLDVKLGPVPAHPLLAALPAEGAQPWWVTALMASPVLAGALAGTVALRRSRPASLGSSLLLGTCTGAATGVAFATLATLARASGPGRLSDVGPQVWPCLYLGTAAMALGGALAGLAAYWLRGRPLTLLQRLSADRG